MWRSLRLSVLKSKISSNSAKLQRLYSSSSSSSGSGKLIGGVITAAGLGFTGAVVYGKYDPKFKNLLEENVPYFEYVYKLFPGWEDKKKTAPTKDTLLTEEKVKDSTVSSGLLKKKLDREKASATEVQKTPVETKNQKDTTVKSNAHKNIENNHLKKSEIEPAEENILEAKELEFASKENSVSELIKKLEKSSEEASMKHKAAIEAIKCHTRMLYEALDMPEGKSGDIVWKDAHKAGSEKNIAVKLAKQKASETKMLAEKLREDIKKILEKDLNHPLGKTGEESVMKALKLLQTAEAEVTSVENEAKTAVEYQELVNTSKEQFRKELQIVLPNYIHGDKDKTVTESDLNLLIAHAHRRIELLQKQLAKQQVTEKFRVDEAVRNQKIQDDKMTDSKIEAELERRHMDLESAVAIRVSSLKENFEDELRQQLRRQAAAHTDHIQEVLKVQEQELDRRYSLELGEKLLHQKGVFISEVLGNMARLKGILAYLKAKGEFDKSSKKAQALWLACQAMNDKLTADISDHPCPLAKDVAAVKIAADENSEFVSLVLAAIPSEAVNRGVYTNEVLKQRFQNVKKVCSKVAMIDENNDSLYRYMLSYLQSLLIMDTASIPKEEREGKVAVDPSEWDTFDILCRVSYCLKINDMEQALRYANQLKGEPMTVAKDWMNEVRLFLETRLAVQALLAHAAAVGVQAYH